MHALAFMSRDASGQRVLKELIEVSGFDAHQGYLTKTLYQEDS
ncbi:conjugative transfer protein TrbB [Vibrio astriarenae]|nr:conjugative transfer protein TrbB [Vibrio sp. C7]